MALIKTTIATAIISLGIAGGFYILKNYNADLPTPLQNQTTAINKNSSDVLNNPIAGQTSLPTANAPIQSAGLSENLTDLLLEELGKTIVQKNPGGPETVGGLKQITAPNPETITQELLAQAAQKFNPESLKPTIKDSDLKIIKNNSEENITNYLLSLKKILSDSARDLPKNLYNNSDELSLLTIQQLRNTYGGAILKIYNISVPEKALDIHKEEIALLSTKKNIFEKILAYETDPLTAIIAVNELKNTDAEFQKLSNRVAKFIKDYNLSI